MKKGSSHLEESVSENLVGSRCKVRFAQPIIPPLNSSSLDAARSSGASNPAFRFKLVQTHYNQEKYLDEVFRNHGGSDRRADADGKCAGWQHEESRQGEDDHA